MELSSILSNGESNKIEFKESMGDSAYKTLSAFSNTDGGILLVGVSDDTEIVGTSCTDSALRNITSKISDTMGIHPLITCVEEDGKKIIKIEVEKSRIPITYGGRYYKRVGNTTRVMLHDDLKDILLADTNWDSLTNEYDFNEIKIETIEKFVKMAKKTGRLRDDDQSDSAFETLKKLSLIDDDDKLTNAAIILFGKNPQKYFTNAIIKVGRFRGNDIISDRSIEGNLFEQAENAQEVIKLSINVKYKVENGLARVNIWDYPLDALREALLNSIVHRDYFRYDTPTQIKIYDDYLWIYNVGGLYGGLTIEKLKTIHPSVTRNPLIANVFYRSGLVEVLGSGIKRMINSLKDANLEEPSFKEESGGFSVCMKNRLSTAHLKELGLNKSQIKAMEFVYSTGSITMKDYSKIVPEINKRTLRNYLADLVRRKLLRKIGKTRGTRYELI